MPASRECRDWCCPGGELKEWIGVTAGAEIAGPGIVTDGFVEIAAPADDRLEVGRVPTEGGGISSDTLGEGKDDVVVEETGRSGGSDTVAGVEWDDSGTGGILVRV